MAFFFGHQNGVAVERTTDPNQFTHAVLHSAECLFERYDRDAKAEKDGGCWELSLVLNEAEEVFCIGIAKRDGFAQYTSGADEAGERMHMAFFSDYEGRLRVEWQDNHHHHECSLRGEHGSLHPVPVVRLSWRFVPLEHRPERRGRTYAFRPTEIRPYD